MCLVVMDLIGDQRVCNGQAFTMSAKIQRAGQVHYGS